MFSHFAVRPRRRPLNRNHLHASAQRLSFFLSHASVGCAFTHSHEPNRLTQSTSFSMIDTPHAISILEFTALRYNKCGSSAWLACSVCVARCPCRQVVTCCAVFPGRGSRLAYAFFTSLWKKSTMQAVAVCVSEKGMRATTSDAPAGQESYGNSTGSPHTPLLWSPAANHLRRRAVVQRSH